MFKGSLSLALFLQLQALLPAVCASSAQSQDCDFEVKGGYVQRIKFLDSETGQLQVLDLDDFLPGRSSGATASLGGQSFPISAADDINLATHFVRNNEPNQRWEVQLGHWYDVNRSGFDFFVFEVGGDDDLQVRPILTDGSEGQARAFTNWKATDYVIPAGPAKGELVYCIPISVTDLLDPEGAAITVNTDLQGLVIESSGVDGAAFISVNPQPLPLPPSDSVVEVLQPPGGNRVWHTSTLLVQGPRTSELKEQPNPFLDIRLQTLFTGPSGQQYDVPGFFFGRGSKGRDGDRWKVHFTPDEAGEWSFEVSLRVGEAVAVSLDPEFGSPFVGVDGVQGQFTVQALDPEAEGFAKWGRLQYVDSHYLKFQDGPYFLKGGTDSPENLLAYFGIEDGQFGCNLGIVHRYGPHVADFQAGDPLFVSSTTSEDSKGIIGALNYLSSRHVNSVYFLTMNLGGDGNDVFPFIGSGGSAYENQRYDVGKLEQWETVLAYAQRKDIFLHFVLGETEIGNEQWLDNGTLGVERKLYYREMVARFGHLLALKWNISEENDFSIAALNEFGDFIRAQDPYDHIICVHTNLNDLAQYDELYNNPTFRASSIQYTKDNAGQFVEEVRERSVTLGRPWIVDMDENGTASEGLSSSNAVDLRKRVLWDIYLSGGQLEWYLGAHPLPEGGDQTLEDFRTREEMWDYTWFARQFLESLPFWDMRPMDELVTGESTEFGGAEVFAVSGEVYAIYLPRTTGNASLNLTSASGTFTKTWFNPRNGVWLPATDPVLGGQTVAIGSPPFATGNDWALVLTLIE